MEGRLGPQLDVAVTSSIRQPRIILNQSARIPQMWKPVLRTEYAAF
jgi:hypothetical protein